MKKTIRNLIDYLYLYFENKRISKQIENKNLKWISGYNNKNKYIHAFFDLSNSRSTYDIVGYLIYLSSYRYGDSYSLLNVSLMWDNNFSNKSFAIT